MDTKRKGNKNRKKNKNAQPSKEDTDTTHNI